MKNKIKTQRGIHETLSLCLATLASYPPPIPGFTRASNIYTFYRNNTFSSYYVDTLLLNLRMVRALQIAGGDQECFIHRACDSLQLGLPQVLRRGLHLDFEVL